MTATRAKVGGNTTAESLLGVNGIAGRWSLYICLFTGKNRFDLVPFLLLWIWQIHYLNRAFIFPFRIRSTARQMPLLIPMFGTTFNTLNA